MAYFCKQCSLEFFGEDRGDLKGLVYKNITNEQLKAEPDKNKYSIRLICEGCGFTNINEEGECVYLNCELHGVNSEKAKKHKNRVCENHIKKSIVWHLEKLIIKDIKTEKNFWGLLRDRWKQSFGNNEDLRHDFINGVDFIFIEPNGRSPNRINWNQTNFYTLADEILKYSFCIGMDIYYYSTPKWEYQRGENVYRIKDYDKLTKKILLQQILAPNNEVTIRERELEFYKKL